MNKIINGRKYDTETAEMICYDGILNVNGCTRCTNLYKKRNGEYFFHCMTMWQGETDSIVPIDGIPMEFLESELSAYEIEKLLGKTFEE